MRRRGRCGPTAWPVVVEAGSFRDTAPDLPVVVLHLFVVAFVPYFTTCGLIEGSCRCDWTMQPPARSDALLEGLD